MRHRIIREKHIDGCGPIARTFIHWSDGMTAMGIYEKRPSHNPAFTKVLLPLREIWRGRDGFRYTVIHGKG